MPLSTGSIDSGFFGCSTDNSLKKGDSVDLHKSSPLSMTDEEETLSTSSSGFSRSSAPAGEAALSLSSASIQPPVFLALNSGMFPRKPRARVRRSNRKLKRLTCPAKSRCDSLTSLLPATSSVSTGISSCCHSVAGSSRSSTSSSPNSHSYSIDELALRLYFYFKSLLISVNKQKTICENIAYLVRDFDARWGNSGVRKKACDPKGCLAPVYSTNRFDNESEQKLVAPAKFPLCWAVPQPAIFYQLMANDVLEYIKFLERVSPQVKSQHQPSGLPIQNEREASASMEALKALQYQQQWQHHMARGVFLPQFVYTAIDNQMRQLKNRDHQSQHQHSQLQRVPSFDGEFSAGKELRKRDSSNDSQCSSEANPNDIPQMMEKLDADLDKTPVVDEEGIRKSRKNVANSGRKDHRKMNGG
ncbi:hypothetical protein B9Z55_002433 [Caenorhabditis nigoni]|uniref:Uncharacterized protein n=2 Tax=Caenorhabditis nigoni TaxID=1611254 RepID=A0A2G5VKR0_9PELO|nr:hypothetical protein B9Z55_002433 [Caenorhabditis nigoni]